MRVVYKTLSLIVVVGLLSLAIVGGTVFAQEGSSGPSEPPGRPGQQHGDGHRPDNGLRELIDHDAIKSVIATTLGLTVEELDAAHEAGTSLEELAEAQGVTIETVQAAAKAEAIAQINQAVTDGSITQEEADDLIDRITNSNFPLGRHKGRPGDDPRNGGLREIIDHEAVKNAIASILGLTIEELNAAHEAGTSLEELAETQGVTIETVQAAAKAEAIAQINQAVIDGTITQAEADELIERINNSDFPLGRHKGRPGGRPERGPRDEADAGATDNENPSVDGNGAAAQSDTTVVTTLFLPLVTR